MQCKYFRKRVKKKQYYYYCVKQKKIIYHSNCNNCKYKEYKIYKPIKKRTYKQSKKEKTRYSIIYTNLNKCAECGSIYNIERNEVFEGAYRGRSIKYGMIAPFCHDCHNRFHNDYEMNLRYKVRFQQEFLKNHTRDEFINIFKQDYIYIQKVHKND